MTTAQAVIAALDLAPHPEGGWYRQTWVADGPGRPVGTAIYFLLEAGKPSHWHRVDAVEIWHFYAGAPLELGIADPGERRVILGSDLIAGQRPQVVVPAHAWQQARSLGDWSLVGCTVAPGFEFDGFEMAPVGWSPPKETPGG